MFIGIRTLFLHQLNLFYHANLFDFISLFNLRIYLFTFLISLEAETSELISFVYKILVQSKNSREVDVITSILRKIT